jgi:hypothetical protein
VVTRDNSRALGLYVSWLQGDWARVPSDSRGLTLTPRHGHQYGQRQDDDQPAERGREDCFARADIQGLPDGDDPSDEHPDRHREPDEPAQDRDNAEHVEHAWGLREADGAEQLAPGGRPPEQLGADQGTD